MTKKKSAVATGSVGSSKPAGAAAVSHPKKTRKAPAAEKPASSSWMSAAAMREMVESVVVAFVLAFLFRTFEAEAFVIPTGSMAPTLMGRHRDLRCPKCGYSFQVNASSEIDPRTNRLTGEEVVAGTCPMCRFTLDLAPNNPQRKSYPSFKGDRILVSKFPYEFGNPARWDVAVFKYPGGAKTNYIKRICGLPKETLFIHNGDLFVKPDGQEEVAIARKPPEKILAMMQPVYDNGYVLPGLVPRGLPARWTPETPKTRGTGGWQVSDDLKSFTSDGTSGEEVWLGYRHYTPSYHQWEQLQSGAKLPDGAVRYQLITDFTAYDTEQTRSSRRQSFDRTAESLAMGPPPSPQRLGLHWVGDLVLECSVKAEQSSGQVLLTLVQGGALFRCELDLASGKATLSIDGVPDFRPTASTRFRGPGKHNVRLANVDQRLTLWVDGWPVTFDTPTTFGPLNNSRPQLDDLVPARIGSRGAAVRVSHLRLFRDIYYIAQRYSPQNRNGSPMVDYETSAAEFPFFFGSDDPEEKLIEFLSNPDGWDVFNHRRQVDFHLAQDQFLALGDNSAESKDSRLWELDSPQYYISRDLLIGRALFVYWPHSWDRIPGTEGWPLLPNGLWFPFFPNFARMGFVR